MTVLAGRLLALLVSASAVAGAAAIVLMMLQIVADVVMKNVFGRPIPLTTVFVANYYMVAAAYLPLALTEKLDRHISAELLVRHMAAAPGRWLRAAVHLAGALIAGAAAWELQVEAAKRFRSGTAVVDLDFTMPTWPSYFILPAGFGLFALVLLYRVLIGVTGLASGLGETPIGADDGKSDHAGAGDL